MRGGLLVGEVREPEGGNEANCFYLRACTAGNLRKVLKKKKIRVR